MELDVVENLELLGEASEPVQLMSQDGASEEEARQIIEKITKAFEIYPDYCAIAAPQLGVKKRIFGIKFEDSIKFFINPIITRKKDLQMVAEKFINLPNKEILIGRPAEITAVYYTDEFKYEDNKLLGYAAASFDQMCQILDGVTPNELGLVSDINEDGKISDLTEDEFAQAVDLWKKYISVKLNEAEKEINKDADLKKYYTALKFDESVINGRTQVLEPEKKYTGINRAQRRLDSKLAKKAARKANLRKGK